MNNYFGAEPDENDENHPKERFPIWLKITGAIALGVGIAILVCKFGFLILLAIWALIYVFGLLIGKGW